MRAFEFLTEASPGKKALDYKRSNRYPDGKPIPDSLPDRYQPANFPGVPSNQKCSNCVFYKPGTKKCTRFGGDPVVRPTYWCAKWESTKDKLAEAAEKPAVGRDLQHLEDLVIVNGSAGALEAVDDIEEMSGGADDVTIKWDGSPAIYFGRNANGVFVLTDTAGFAAKGYDGKVTSGEDLESMLLRRGKEVTPERQQFASNMRELWDNFESMVEPNFRGYIKGDLLYYTQPPVDNTGDYVFKPNTVTYRIPAESSVGVKIAKSVAGVVIHNYTNLEGTTSPVPANGLIKGIKQQGPVMIQGPVVINAVPSIGKDALNNLRNNIAGRANAIDSLLDDTKLAANQMSDFRKILYTFVNQQVDTGDMTNLNAKFDKWLTTSKVSGPKQAKIQSYRKEYASSFEAIFKTLEEIMAVKDDIIDQLDQQSEIKAEIDGASGGEGYVKAKRGTKYVKRAHFTAANRAKIR